MTIPCALTDRAFYSWVGCSRNVSEVELLSGVFKSFVSLVIFYVFFFPSVTERKMAKSPTMIVDLFFPLVPSVFATCVLKLYY